MYEINDIMDVFVPFNISIETVMKNSGEIEIFLITLKPKTV